MECDEYFWYWYWKHRYKQLTRSDGVPLCSLTKHISHRVCKKKKKKQLCLQREDTMCDWSSEKSGWFCMITTWNLWCLIPSLPWAWQEGSEVVMHECTKLSEFTGPKLSGWWASVVIHLAADSAPQHCGKLLCSLTGSLSSTLSL